MADSEQGNAILAYCWRGAYLLLALAIGSAEFYDPTFFNQSAPVQGIQNWLGWPGALLGGTLLELLGPAALMLPWFGLRATFLHGEQARPVRYWYHAWFLLIMLSTLQALAWPWLHFQAPEAPFLLHTGYLGILAAQWLQTLLTLQGAQAAVGIMILVLGVRIYRDLPFRFAVYAVALTSMSPLYALRYFWTQALPSGIDWLRIRYQEWLDRRAHRKRRQAAYAMPAAEDEEEALEEEHEFHFEPLEEEIESPGRRFASDSGR